MILQYNPYKTRFCEIAAVFLPFLRSWESHRLSASVWPFWKYRTMTKISPFTGFFYCIKFFLAHASNHIDCPDILFLFWLKIWRKTKYGPPALSLTLGFRFYDLPHSFSSLFYEYLKQINVNKWPKETKAALTGCRSCFEFQEPGSAAFFMLW